MSWSLGWLMLSLDRQFSSASAAICGVDLVRFFLRNVWCFRLLHREGDDHGKAARVAVALLETEPSSMGANHMVHDCQPQAAMALLSSSMMSTCWGT